MAFKNRKAIAAVSVIIIVVAGTYLALSFPRTGQTLTVYAADAYVPEVNALLEKFHNNTGLDYAPVVGGGSYSDARQIALGSPASIFFSVSIEAFKKSFIGNYSSGWALAFASDQMVLAYSNHTLVNRTATRIISDFNLGTPENNTTLMSNAFSALSSGLVRVGISDPLSDPAGVRAWLTLEMAGYLYHNGNKSYFTETMMKNKGNYTESNAAELISPLSFGQIQFLFIYKSAAINHHLKYVSLPGAVNQGNASMKSFYGRFSFNVAGNPVYGSPILLFVSNVGNGTDQAGAREFISFLVNNTNVFSRFGLTLLSPMLLYGNPSDQSAIRWAITEGIAIRENPGL